MKENKRIMPTPLDILHSTKEERKAFVEQQWECMNHCPSCGKCQILRGNDPLELYDDYIEGKRTYRDITLEIRKK